MEGIKKKKYLPVLRWLRKGREECERNDRRE
jgi:hypothetical protein